MAHDIERAAPFDARRFKIVDKLHRNVERQPRTGDNAHEIDMAGLVADRIELKIARDNPQLLAADIYCRQRREEAAAVNPLSDFPIGKRNGK